MTERLITHLRHVDLAVPDFDRQRTFSINLWGLTPVADEDGIVFLAAGGSPEQYIARLRRDADMEQLDEDSWHPQLQDATDPAVSDQWGTANPMDELVARESFNEPDRGIFTPPPV